MNSIVPAANYTLDASENTGTATIITGESEVVVTHGLAIKLLYTVRYLTDHKEGSPDALAWGS